VHDDTERDKILEAEDAVAYGLVDRVMSRRGA
jgi:ATP-dependent protease ClpP protease subunit